MRILALDQARACGWSVFDYETKELVDYGAFTFGNLTHTYYQAVAGIVSVVDELIKKYDVEAVFAEDIQLRQNVVSFKRLAWIQGALIGYLEPNEYLYDFVHPTQWQNFCKARTRTSKEIKGKVTEVDGALKKSTKVLSIQYVKDKFGVVTTNDNLADSICIGDYVVNKVEIKEIKNDG